MDVGQGNPEKEERICEIDEDDLHDCCCDDGVVVVDGVEVSDVVMKIADDVKEREVCSRKMDSGCCAFAAGRTSLVLGAQVTFGVNVPNSPSIVRLL